MEDVLIKFIHALRNAQVSVSPAESIDALNAVALVGYSQRQLLHDSLSIALAKSDFEKQRFDQCFDQFFRLDPFNWDGADNVDNDAAESSECPAQDGDQAAASEGGEDGAADGGAGGGESEPGDDQGNGDTSLQQALDLEDIAASLAQSDIELPAAAAANDPNAESASTETPALSRLGVLIEALLTNDQVSIALQIQAAAAANNLEGIRYSTQRSLYRYRILQTLQVNAIERVARALTEGTAEARAQAESLYAGLQQLRDQVGDYVDQQLLLNAEAATRELREDILQTTNLSVIEQRHLETMQSLVHKMSKALVARYARRRRIQRRGQLDIARTIRHNINHDGVLFDTYWKSKRKERPDIFAICDVSGSVAAYSRFLLMFLYSLADVLPKTRSFAFSSNLGEVTDLFRQHTPAQAIEQVNRLWGFGSSSYGDSFHDFDELAFDDLRPTSTVIILGDGRTNGGNPGLDILKRIYQRCACVIWLNPETRGSWSSGDSEMMRYLSAVHYANSCQSLRQLESAINEMLRRSV